MGETVKVWDAKTGKLLFSLPGHYAEFSPDGNFLASVIADGTVRVWDADSGNEIQIPGQMDAMVSVSFSPDGKRLSTVTNGNLPRIWDLKTGKEFIKRSGNRFTVLNEVIKARFTPKLEADTPFKLEPNTPGILLDESTIADEYQWQRIKYEGWVTLVGLSGKEYATYAPPR